MMNLIRLAFALAAFMSLLITVMFMIVFGAFGLVMLAAYIATGKLWSV